MLILFADDDKVLRDYIESSIPSDFNDILDIVGTAKEVIELIKNNNYDKAVIDLMFEGEPMNGFDIIKCAEENGVQERIIFTSVSNQIDVKSIGATAAFRKPLSMNNIAKFLFTNDYDLLKDGDFF